MGEFPLSLRGSSHRVIFGGALLITKYHNTSMRLLSKLEQQLCWLILQGDGHYNYLANILDDYLPDAKIYVSKQEEQEVYILYKMFARDRENFPFDERDAQIRRLILVTVNLIKLLEQEGYIMLFMNASEEPNSSIGAGPDILISADGEEQTVEIESEIKDAYVIQLLAEYSSKAIYVTEEFRVFCENDYIPRSDVQFNKNLNLTRQSFELSRQSFELSKQSLGKARTSNRIAIATLIITFLSFLVSIAASWGWRPSFFS